MAGLGLTVVGVLQFCWRNVSAVLVEPSVIEPIDPFGGGILDLLDGPPRAPVFDQLGLIQTVDRLGKRIIERIPNVTNRSRDASLGQVLREPHRSILTRFNRWTQHLNDGGAFDGTTTGLGGSIDGTGGDAVAGSAACPTGSRTRVLGADRAWAHERGRGGRVRRVESGGITVVPTRWRDAADRACPGVGEISVLLRTGRHRGPAGGGNQHATDRDPDRKVTVDDISGTASQRRHPQREARLPGIDGAMEGRSRRTTTQSSETR